MTDRLAEQELRQRGVRALEEKLGPVEALRFLALVSRDPFDYQKWRDEYFLHHTEDGLFEDIRKQEGESRP